MIKAEKKRNAVPSDISNASDPAPDKSPVEGDEAGLENLVECIGGHGPFQFFVWGVGFGSKACAAGVFLYMSFAGVTPDFWCAATSGGSGNGSDVTEAWWEARRSVSDPTYKACSLNGTTCSSFVFADDKNTIVNTWSLVCEEKWVSSTITSVQMVGVLLGALTAGQLGDLWGRRKTSIAMLIGEIVFSLANAFSPNWIFFIITRFGAGFSAGGYLVPYFALTMEFTDVQWRAFLGAIPAWPIGAGLMSLAAWLLHDWQHLGIAVAAFCVPFLVAWWFMPESVRWLMVHGRVKEAQAVLKRAARWNGTQAPEDSLTSHLAAVEVDRAKKQHLYTFRDLFRTRPMVRTTCLLFFVWFSSGAVYYFLAFGAENLSGNLYLNIFLLSVVEAPAMFLSAYLNNKIGRRWTAFLCYLAAGLCAVTVIILIHTGVDGSAVNGVVIASKLAMGGGWAAVLVFSAEQFPTVVRNIGYGAQNMASRVGAIVAPQMVFLYTSHPSIPYAVVAFLMLGSALCFLKLRETNDQALEDVLPMRVHPVRRQPTTEQYT
ncbi:organic cation transporter protein-like [Babylonia areolata]|uniref:organic cation transporter protein-like n=1 Tax=Babylonia areolata TaxID=304850 RepID=UPI003FD34842